MIVYLAIPIAYWGFDLYDAKRFPIFSSDLFTSEGQPYNITGIVNDQFELDVSKYQEQGPIRMCMFFALTYGFGFATITATLTHVARLMRKYKDIPSWWFYLLLVVTIIISLILCFAVKDQVQMPS